MSTASRPGRSLPAALQRRLRRQLTVLVSAAAVGLAAWLGVLMMPVLDRLLMVGLLLLVSYALTVSLVDFFRRE
ncbi:hypothetical protein G3N18_01925 [Microbacterium sp. 2C]|uniref:hypothetical protein n=1 Tax=Microbacterium paulum TaxID=2707006 RepID=UPI0018C25E96|nr:hypothetical protein [Microbacterium paulum]MBG0716845.1 hypothetical protein [Microbacterium paulum]